MCFLLFWMYESTRLKDRMVDMPWMLSWTLDSRGDRVMPSKRLSSRAQFRKYLRVSNVYQQQHKSGMDQTMTGMHKSTPI